MSPLDIAAFAAPISFIIAIFSGLSGMAIDAVTDLAIFSLVHVIMAAEAGAAMEGAKRVDSSSTKTNCDKFGFREKTICDLILLVVSLMFRCPKDVLVASSRSYYKGGTYRRSGTQ